MAELTDKLKNMNPLLIEKVRVTVSTTRENNGEYNHDIKNEGKLSLISANSYDMVVSTLEKSNIDRIRNKKFPIYSNVKLIADSVYVFRRISLFGKIISERECRIASFPYIDVRINLKLAQ